MSMWSTPSAMILAGAAASRARLPSRRREGEGAGRRSAASLPRRRGGASAGSGHRAAGRSSRPARGPPRPPGPPHAPALPCPALPGGAVPCQAVRSVSALRAAAWLPHSWLRGREPSTVKAPWVLHSQGPSLSAEEREPCYDFKAGTR